MKRFRLSAKLAMAIIPIGLVALAAAGFIAFSFLEDSVEQSQTANAATITADATAALKAVWDEEGQARQVSVFENDAALDDLVGAKERTDEAFERLENSVAELRANSDGFFGEVAFGISEDVKGVVGQLNAMRAITNPTDEQLSGYQNVGDSLLAVIPKSSSIVSDRLQARDLSTAYFLAEGGQVSLQQEQLIEEFRANEPTSPAALESQKESLQATLEVREDAFGSWARRANQTANRRNAAILRYTRLPNVNIDTFPLARNEDILRTSENLAQGVAAESQTNAVNSETRAYLVAGFAAIVLLLAIWGSYAVIRSVVRRVRGVTTAAVQVSEVDLPNLVDALSNPKQEIVDLSPTVIESAGHDEVGDLASSFTALHSTLIDVASQQVDILRKGVSEIFVTLARRNRSLVDRQLALLDELESREEDSETLGGYYKLDHLATRMRRNAESLLVLAGSEPTRVWAEPLEVSEIIRAALGEVDEYQRVDIMALEPALISGRAVADIAHLMSELLDNGTQYSPPSERVRVAGLFDPDGYMLTVADTGIGMTEARMADLNELLASPPVLGLALQPTLGMYVVARLAARYKVNVQLVSGSPGVTVRVLLPKDLIEPARPREELPELASPSDARSVHEHVPPLGTAALNGASAHGVVLAAGSLASHINEEGEDAATEDQTTGLIGSIKGKHEQPGRPGVLVDDEVETHQFLRSETPSEGIASEADDVSPEDPFAAPDQQVAGTLIHRVPGEALNAEEAHDIDAFEPDRERLEEPLDDEEPWWTKEMSTPVAAPEDEADSFDLWGSELDDVSERSPTDDPAEPEEAGHVLRSGLPVRTPGTSFTEIEDGEASSSPSESGAMGIRSALSSFAGGREMAAGGSNPDSDGEEDGPGGDE